MTELSCHTSPDTDLGPLNRALFQFVQDHSPRMRCHVPGHAGRSLVSNTLPWLDAVFPFDLTELPPLDVLSHPTGVLAESQAMIAKAYGAAYSFYLVNGATIGLMAALQAHKFARSNATSVLVARNAHRAVLQGLFISDLEPVWVLPNFDEDWQLWQGVSVEALEAARLAQPEVSAVILPHPTYEGFSSALDEIVAWCREHGLTLIVDEAHGSLWPLFNQLSVSCDIPLPKSALLAGADAVVHSCHKSAGSLTQTAMVHLGHHSNIPPEALVQAINLLQTSSPSYVLLANLEATMSRWASPEGLFCLAELLIAIDRLKQNLASACQSLRFNTNSGPFQLVCGAEGMDGELLATLLEDDFNVAYEAFGSHSVLLCLHPAFTPEEIARLESTLMSVDAHLSSKPEPALANPRFQSITLPKKIMSFREAMMQPGQLVPRQAALGRVAKELVAPCPPGIPVVVPGEAIDANHLNWLPSTISVCN